jgi:hypothetical protein
MRLTAFARPAHPISPPPLPDSPRGVSTSGVLKGASLKFSNCMTSSLPGERGAAAWGACAITAAAAPAA